MGVKRLKEPKRKVETSNKFHFESELWNIITNYCLPKFVGLDYFIENYGLKLVFYFKNNLDYTWSYSELKY